MLSTLGVNLNAELKVRAQPPLSLISLYISRARRQYTPWGRTRILERRARASLNLNPSITSGIWWRAEHLRTYTSFLSTNNQSKSIVRMVPIIIAS